MLHERSGKTTGNGCGGGAMGVIMISTSFRHAKLCGYIAYTILSLNKYQKRVRGSSVGSASACCKASSNSIFGSAPPREAFPTELTSEEEMEKHNSRKRVLGAATGN